MKSLIAFLKKELLENLRSGKVIIFTALFMSLGLMNPAIAKLTPILLDFLSESLAESGMVITEAAADAFASWVQFFKNIPIALIVFIIIYSASFTKEYSSGTLILILTKGLERYKVVISKAAIMMGMWTLGYWICFAITYICNAWLWDNSVVSNLASASFNFWLFGIFTICLIVLFSTVFSNYIGVLLGTGSTVLASYVISLLPKISKYFPTSLMSSTSLLMGHESSDDYIRAVIITCILCVTCIAVSIPVMNKKQL